MHSSNSDRSSKVGLDIVSIAKGYGCDAARLDRLEEIKKPAVEAWSKSKPPVLEIPISGKYRL
jgi:benzoylformate decarboxylase